MTISLEDRDASPSAPFASADVLVVVLILSIGVLQLLLCNRAHFLHDDVFYADAARSLLRSGLYGIDGRPETNQPPGLSMLLASVCATLGCGHLAFLRTMVVCATLGLVAAYDLLRREAPRPVAAAICVLLASSTFWFGLATAWVFPAFPFLLATMLALLALRRLEEATRPGPRAVWAAVSAALAGSAILFASAGIALIGAMVGRGAAVFRRDRGKAIAVLKAYAPVLIVGLAVQIAWMDRKPPPLEWPEVPGYPASYLSQLNVKSGNQPELGFVTAKDIPIRVARNLFERSKMLAQFLVGYPMSNLWVSAVILGTLFLVLIGWAYSIWKSGGGALHDWYFAGHEFIYLVWPWDTEPRFVAGIAPLMCLYLWRGVVAVSALASTHARLLGLVWSPAAVVALLASTQVSLRGGRGGVAHGVASIAVWIGSGSVAAWMAWTGRAPLGADSRSRALLARWRMTPRPALRRGAVIAIVCLLLVQLAGDVRIGRENLHPSDVPPDDVEAALWIRSHTDPGAVIMARHVPIFWHVSNRKVIWFPPLSNPVALMRGIRRSGVGYVILANSGGDDYYLPIDYECFAPLAAAFPESFRVAFRDERIAIYQVTNEAASGP